MTTKLVNVRYEDGKRIATQEIINQKSDDLYALANLQRRYESLCTMIANPPDGYDVTRLEADKLELEAEISLQEGYLAGYDNAEVQ